MTKTWFDYYQGHQTNLTNWLLHWPYLLKIIASRPRRVLEFGCGPADHSFFLKRVCPKLEITLLDGDKKLLDHLKNMNTGLFESFYHLDLTSSRRLASFLNNEPRFDLMYSQGLMEHFGQKEFIQIISNLLPFTKMIIFSVPSSFYPTKDFGNERLRTKKQLTQILKKIPNINFSVRPYWPDIGIRTKKIAVDKAAMGLTQAIWFYLFGSCHWLVQIEPTKS